MKNSITKKTLSITVATLLFGAATGFAYDREGQRDEQRRDHEELRLGICVGQTLSQQGITIPALEPGQTLSSLDSTTLDALEAAITTCKADMTGAPQPTSSTPPALTPTPTPSPLPSPSNPIPVPTTSSTP